MCGILSIFHAAGPSTCLQPVWDMVCDPSSTLAARGPDHTTVIMNSQEVLSFHRLAIMDKSVGANQPFFSGDKKVALLCNGEIYNYRELIQKHDLHCVSGSDCEVLLRLYEKNGISMLQELDGVFALVIRDYRANKVYAARDYIGVRPLFFGVTVDGNPAFASVAAALLPFCRNYVKQVPPSSCYEIDLGAWDADDGAFQGLRFTEFFAPVTLADSPASLRHLLYRAVQKRLMGDRPIGCLLSGGLDSSVIVSILVRLGVSVNTYSIGLEGSGEEESLDLKFARTVSEHFWTNHTAVTFSVAEGLAAIPDVIRSLESYDITTVRASVGMYLLAKYIKTHSEDRIIFSGEGSDELFAGYLYFKKAPSAAAVKLESSRLVSELPFFDVLRADRCLSAHGLELREPFLDVDVVEFARGMGVNKCPYKGVEKYHLRTCFEGDLPPEVLWRKKDGFSDGVSGKKTWAAHIQEFVETQVCDGEFAAAGGRFPSKEAYYYFRIFSGMYPSFEHCIPHYWMPRWVGSDVKDPSGRLIQ